MLNECDILRCAMLMSATTRFMTVFRLMIWLQVVPEKFCGHSEIVPLVRRQVVSQ